MKRLLSVAFAVIVLTLNIIAATPFKLPAKGDVQPILHQIHGKAIYNLKISIERPIEFNLYWSDPGYVKGPEWRKDCDFYVISFTTRTLTKDKKGILYSDDWVYYFPVNGEKYGFLRNRYYGKGYHGGSLKYIYTHKNKVDSLQECLTREWNKEITKLHRAIFSQSK